VIDDADLAWFFEGLDSGLISLARGGRFNTLDRPMPGGRWALLSRSRGGGWYNAEYLPQLAAYVELIRRLGYPAGRVLFELPSRSLQLDLAVVTDAGAVAALGEAKRAAMLERLAHAVGKRFRDTPPGDENKRRGDEARQLAWRLWTTRTPICGWSARERGTPTGAAATRWASADPVAARSGQPRIGHPAHDRAGPAAAGLSGAADGITPAC
jgi:hypothetical protein